MKAIAHILHELETARYLSARLATNGISIEILNLLENGKSYCKQLKTQWLRTIDKQIPTYHFPNHKQKLEVTVNEETPYTFIYTKEFQENMQILQQKCPGIVKRTMLINNNNDNNKNNANKDQDNDENTAKDNGVIVKENAFQLSHNENVCTQLITDYFIPPSLGKEKFYNLQRARKIWWMLYSANASRYNLEATVTAAPIDKNVTENNKFSIGCQTVNITSHFSFGSAIVEQLSLVPLREVMLPDYSADYNLYDVHTKAPIQPTVIRAKVNLEVAACALLFDGFEQRGDGSLLIDRNLAPIQCALFCLHDGIEISNNLHDLCRHIIYVILELGLRVNDEILTNSKQQIVTEFNQIDNLGVPYAIIVTENTLSTGLLKLRNRDTTLAETIHISDIKEYFKCIFKPYDAM